MKHSGIILVSLHTHSTVNTLPGKVIFNFVLPTSKFLRLVTVGQIQLQHDMFEPQPDETQSVRDQNQPLANTSEC